MARSSQPDILYIEIHGELYVFYFGVVDKVGEAYSQQAYRLCGIVHTFKHPFCRFVEVVEG